MKRTLRVCSIICISAIFVSIGVAQEGNAAYDSHRSRTHGMLIGSLIGDAAGGPVEFKSNDELKRWLPDLRSWSAERFRESLRDGTLAKKFEILPYKGIRNEIAPYGPWEKEAEAGTITDDSRHKMILLNCLRELGNGSVRGKVTESDLAKAYINYAAAQATRDRKDYERLSNESLNEYVAVAKWILGERDLNTAKPPQRLWAGIATCSGQMTLLPIAAVYPGDPGSAYRASYSLGFVDVGPGKDINSALVAGLAQAIGSKETEKAKRWDEVLEAMRKTDPYGYAAVPFAGRPTAEWIEFALKAAERANGEPGELYRILEKEGRAKYYWDAHFTFAVSIACLKFTEFQPLEAITVSLAFGHDTDSAAQVIGALVGAVNGPDVFPPATRDRVAKRLKDDYDESVEEWTSLLWKLSNRKRFPDPVRFVEE